MDTRELEHILKALANRRRLAILQDLKHDEASVGDLARKLRVSFKATSKHLSILLRTGIVDREQRGLMMFYQLAADMPRIARQTVSLL